MKSKKIRGHSRRQRQTELWRISNLDLAMDSLPVRQRSYVKIHVHPWNCLSLTNSAVPPPAGKTKRAMLSGLLDIYDSWKAQLQRSSQPYYLRIWLYEPHFESSQVVCAIGDSIEFYNNVFLKNGHEKTLKPEVYGPLRGRISQLSWECFADEDAYDNTDLGDASSYSSEKAYEEAKAWFSRLLRRPHRTEKLLQKVGDIEEMYYFRRGRVWVGR